LVSRITDLESGVAGVYRRHNFVEEKQAALEALARLVFDIVK